MPCESETTAQYIYQMAEWQCQTQLTTPFLFFPGFPSTSISAIISTGMSCSSNTCNFSAILWIACIQSSLHKQTRLLTNLVETIKRRFSWTVTYDQWMSNVQFKQHPIIPQLAVFMSCSDIHWSTYQAVSHISSLSK